jgi:hypothetical protein
MEGTMTRTPEYEAYHAKIVEACVALMGEDCRAFFNTQCDYLEEFAESLDPDDVAQAQRESL